jgi:ABC-type nitrate/sulfonate/bicarbonate transport system substrate-binding protein
MIRIRLGSFSNSLVDAVARHAGMYRDERVAVEFCRVFNSPSQFEKLALGEVDVVLTATDNVLNYRHKRSSDIDSPLDVRIVRAVERGGAVSLVARRTVTSLRDLRGALIAVDDTNSGFALLLYELLARAGMVRGLDYRVVAFGGTPRRFDGLIRGDFDATMLNAGFDLRAVDRGFSVLKTVSDVLPDYIATVLAALPCWLEKESAAGAFLRAWDRATTFALDRDNCEICVDIVKEQSAVSAKLAASMYQQAVHPQFGLVPGGQVSRSGVSSVADVRRRHGELDGDVDIAAALREPTGLIDQRYARVV